MTEQQLNTFRSKRREIDHMRHRLDSFVYGGMPSGTQLTGVGVQHGSRVEQEAERAERLRTLYAEQIAAYDADGLQIETEMQALTPDERSVIRGYYMDALTVRQLCDCLHFSERHIYRLRAAAIEKLGKTG